MPIQQTKITPKLLVALKKSQLQKLKEKNKLLTEALENLQNKSKKNNLL
tara:strand:+ start:36 stop:182 length:147 start_codon:yes stop_codon:yes gene_type:complete